MANEQKIETSKPSKSKKRIWNRILLYFVCLLIAILVWVVANYNMWSEKKAEENKKGDTAVTETAAFDSSARLAVTSDTVLYG